MFEQSAEPGGSAPAVLKLEDPESRFRYVMFCLSTVHAVCGYLMQRPGKVLDEVARNLVKNAVAYAGPDGFTVVPVSLQEAFDDNLGHLKDFLHRWSAYADEARGGRVRAGANVVCLMLREVESPSPATTEDRSRLLPLAQWVEGRFDLMHQAFLKLTNPKPPERGEHVAGTPQQVAQAAGAVDAGDRDAKGPRRRRVTPKRRPAAKARKARKTRSERKKKK